MTTNPGRNDRCTCGSGKKFKHCCADAPAKAPTAIGLSASQIPVALRTALANQQAGRTAQAENLFRQILNAAPSHGAALHFLGALLLREGRVEESIPVVRRALKAQPDNFEAAANLGFALHEFGDLKEAEQWYRKAIALNAGYANAYFNLHALLLKSNGLQAAIECLNHCLKLVPADEECRYMLACLLERSGNSAAAQSHWEFLLKGSPLTKSRVDAWQYLRSISPAPAITGSMIETFTLAFAAAPKDGLVLEFGVRFGNTIRQIAGLAKQPVHGFDSFQGLPESWHQEAKGSYSTRGVLPDVPKNVTLHQGWFDQTLPKFLETHEGPVRLINVDCDIYSSTKSVLDLLAPRMVAGSVIVFDEYIGNEHWREDEFKAFQEAVARYGWTYEYLCFSLFTKQVAVRITGI